MNNRKIEPQQPTELIGKIPPQAGDLEQAVLGAIITEQRVLDDIMHILSPEVFYKEHHQLIYQAILSLYRQQKPVDMLMLVEELQRQGRLEEVGGAMYIVELTQKVASGTHAVYHAKVIFQKYIAREMIVAGSEITKLGFEEESDVLDRVVEAENKLGQITAMISSSSNTSHIGHIISESIEQAHKRAELAKYGKVAGITTGLVDLDGLTNGWQKSNLIVLAARPGMGKTAVMLHFAKSAAKKGLSAVIFSLEMSSVSLANRLLLAESKVEADRFKSGYMNLSELQGLEKAGGVLEKLPIHVDDTPETTITQIRAKSRALKKKGKCDIIFIDYLQLLREKGQKGRNREQEVSAMSREAKILAKELDVPVVILSQLNRAVEGRADKRPLLSDLRESGALEQDADIVLFVHRESYYVKDINSLPIEDQCRGEVIVSKNRDGATGFINFRYSNGLSQLFDFDYNRAMEVLENNF